MAERAEHLVALRRLDSQVKRDRVMATLAGFVERGETVTVAGLARRAGVSPRFVYNHPDLRAEIERRAAEIGDQLAGRVVASARVTTASLRADLANYRAEVQRQRVEIGALRERLSKSLGNDYAAGLPEADRLGITATRGAQQRIADVEQAAFELGEELKRRNEELDAVRVLNRELMATLNTERRGTGRASSTKSDPQASCQQNGQVWPST